MNIVLTLASFALLQKVVSQSSICTTCCLWDGVQGSLRKNLTNSNSQLSYAVGLWMNDLDAGHVSTAVASILIEEVFGYHTINRSSGGPQEAYRAVAGCLDPGDEFSCGAAAGTIPTSWHIALDVRQPFQATTTLPTLDFVDAGAMSYVGRRGHFLKNSVSTSGTIRYMDLQFLSFDTISSVDRFNLKQCTNTQLANTTMIRSYLDIVSDSSGVTLGNGGFIAFCPADGYFWLAPSCRSNSSQCIPYFFNSYHRAVDVLEVMQKAAVWNIPWAISVAYDEASFEEVLATSRSMFFLYTPDSQFGLVSPVEVIFPAHNSNAWANGNFSTASTDVSVRKLLSQDLITLAPEVDAFIVAFDLTAAHVETLLADSEALGSFRSGACNWLNNWPEVWEPWIQSVASTTTSTTSTTTPNLATNTTTPANTGTTEAASASSPDELVMGAVNPSVTASVLASMAADRTAFVDVPFSGSQYNLAMEMIGIPTVGWAADQSATFPGSVKELVVTPAELFLTPNPALIVAEGGSDASSAILPAEARPGQNVTVSGAQYQVSGIIVTVSLVELASTSLSPLEVTGLQTPILIRMSTTSPAADTLCVYLDANNAWSQAGVYRPTAAEITTISGSQADTSGIWCATEHLSTFGILLAVNSETDAATECGFIETLTVDNEQCFSPAIFYSIVGVPLLCCCVGFVCCYFKCRRPTKGKLKLQDQKGDAHEFEFQVGKAMTHAGEDHGSDPAKAKIFVKSDVDIEQAKQTDYDYVKSRSGVNVTGTGLLLTTAAQDTKSEKSNSPRSVRSRKLTEAEEEAEQTFKETTNDVHHEDFEVEVVEEETDLPKRSISGIGYEAYGDSAHIEYFSATHNKWLQGCIQGTGSLVEDGKTMIPVYTIVLFGGAHKQVRDFVGTSLLRAPLKVRDPVSIQLGKTEDWRPGVVKSRQSFPLGYEVELLETHPLIDGNTTKVPPERIRPRFPDGSDVEVYRGVKLGWFPGVVKASSVDNTEAWPDVVVEMATHWESDSKEDVTCPNCHVRATQRRPLPVKSSTEHTLEKI